MDETNMTRGSGNLLYKQIIEAVMDQIRSGSFSYDKPICTEAELTERYGVSRITVRRALAELENRGILYRKRGVGSFVRKDIYQLSDFSPPEKGDAGNTSKLFAFVLPFNISRTGLTGTYQAASFYLAEHGCMTSVYISESTGENRARHILDRLAGMNIAGVAYYPYTSNIHLPLIHQLLFAGKPVVLMDLPSPCTHLASVSSDNFHGSLELMKHLLSLGHRRIAFLSGVSPQDRVTVSDRLSGYLISLTEAGIPIDTGLICTSMAEEARSLPEENPASLIAVLKAFHLKGVTAVVTEHDGIAYQVLRACEQIGMKVPEELSVCGFDRSEWVSMQSGKVITTVAQDYPAIGRAVGELLYTGLSRPLTAHSPVIIPTRLIPGNTTGPVPVNG